MLLPVWNSARIGSTKKQEEEKRILKIGLHLRSYDHKSSVLFLEAHRTFI